MPLISLSQPLSHDLGHISKPLDNLVSWINFSEHCGVHALCHALVQKSLRSASTHVRSELSLLAGLADN